MGGGLGLVAACTIAVASLDAKLGTPEIDVGLFPFMIWAVLERVLPRRRLVEMMLTGERLSAEEAARLGLVNRAVPAADLDRTVAEYVETLSAKSPSTLRLGLAAIRDAEGLTLQEKLPLLNQRLLECLATDDAREGLMAFLEKRAPRWTGK
jgi:enoyl-CoA hydratase/carnithine racemase